MSHFLIPKCVVMGNDALNQASKDIKKLGSHAFIVTGKHVGKSPMIEQLKKVLEKSKVEYYIFDGITGEPTDKMIEEGLKLYKETESDFIIGIGGGSPLDSAKAIAAMAVNKGKISDYNGKEIMGNVPGIVAIPTTAGTGSEATKFTVITDQEKDIKMLLKGDCLIPDIAIIDADFTLDMPKGVTAATGLDALTHAVEAFTSKKAFAMTDVYAISAIKRIVKYLPLAYKNGYEPKYREQMSLAAFEAGVCINNSSVTLVHGMSRPIGALFHVAHGLSNAMLLKYCLSFAVDGALEKFAFLGRETGTALSSDADEKAADKFIDKLAEICSICNVPTLKEYGIPEKEFLDSIDKMATDAIASGSPANTRKEVTKENCIAIYKKAYYGA